MLFDTPPPLGASDPGASPDELERLRAENAHLRSKNAELERALSGVVSGGSDVPPPSSEAEDGEELSNEALRKRLWRLCKKDSKGRPCRMMKFFTC